jgi:glycerophosphoryl diester phosphodiesterase
MTEQDREWRFPRWIAHRGAGRIAPENTLAAFRVGASHGYRAFECDAKLSRDAVPFLLHDATLQRTTPERGIASERDWNALSRIDAGGWHSRAYAGEPLPTLAAVSRFVLRNGFALNVEIKPTPGDAARTGEVVAAQAWAAFAGGGSPLLLSSFEPDALAGARRGAPEAPRALLLDRLSDGWLATATALGCAAVVARHDLIDPAMVAAAVASGLRVMAYTVNDPADVRRLLRLGVDGLITDAVDRFSPADDAPH